MDNCRTILSGLLRAIPRPNRTVSIARDQCHSANGSADTLDMSILLYRVTAAMPESVKEDYVAWLRDGHIQAVVDDGGALAAVVEDNGVEDGTATIESRYTFASQAAYDNYTATVAPVLRADGVAKFGSRDVAFSRAFENLTPEQADEFAAQEGAYTGKATAAA